MQIQIKIKLNLTSAAIAESFKPIHHTKCSSLSLHHPEIISKTTNFFIFNKGKFMWNNYLIKQTNKNFLPYKFEKTIKQKIY